jgi:hypothetical protein
LEGTDPSMEAEIDKIADTILAWWTTNIIHFKDPLKEVKDEVQGTTSNVIDFSKGKSNYSEAA